MTSVEAKEWNDDNAVGFHFLFQAVIFFFKFWEKKKHLQEGVELSGGSEQRSNEKHST